MLRNLSLKAGIIYYTIKGWFSCGFQYYYYYYYYCDQYVLFNSQCDDAYKLTFSYCRYFRIVLVHSETRDKNAVLPKSTLL